MRRFRRLKVPEKGNPLIIRIFQEMNDQKIGVDDLCARAGISYETLVSWRWNGKDPKVGNLEAVGNVLGLTLKWSRKK